MGKLIQKLSDIKDIKNIHWRHTVQSILIFSCFCTLDTVAADNNTIWLVSAAAAVAAIAAVMLTVRKIRIGNWSNALNIIGAALCVGCYFTVYLFPVAIFFVTLTACLRLIYARLKLNNYAALVFITASVFSGIVFRFALALLPVWTLSILMLATVFNPIIEKETKNGNEKEKSGDKKKPDLRIISAAILLVAFLLCIEIFGGPLTDEVAHGFPMNMVNLTYLIGYLTFIAVFLIFRTKKTSMMIMLLNAIALFFFLLPTTIGFGIYFMLFLGGGIKVLTLAFPLDFFKGKYKYLGALGGVFVYRLAFLASGLTKTISRDAWDVSSNLTYALAAVNMVLGVTLVFLLAYWDKLEIKRNIESEYGNKIAEIVALTSQKPLPEGLTQREREIALLILEGLNRGEIAVRLFISDGTVKNHTARLLEKTDCDSQKEFILKYK